jgi:choline dehydrogenase-like flavoprotein
MPVITEDKLQDSYDVVIVGSGAGGGQTAYTLTMEGVKVLVLEAGRSFDVQAEVAMFQLPNQAPLRGVATPDKQYGFHDCSINSGWDIPGEPYTQAGKEPENQFRWWRQRREGRYGLCQLCALRKGRAARSQDGHVRSPLPAAQARPSHPRKAAGLEREILQSPDPRCATGRAWAGDQLRPRSRAEAFGEKVAIG